MERAVTYRGYNSENNCIASCTAQDANQWINPEEVQRAIAKVEEVFKEEMRAVGNGLQDIVYDADESVIVQGTKMGPTIEETARAINSLPSQAMEGISTLYEYSVQAHDNLQRQANRSAYNAVASKDGVVSIS